MGKTREALSGVVISAGLIGGAYLLDSAERDGFQEEIEFCIEAFEGERRTQCVDDVYDPSDFGVPDVVGTVGVVGLLGFGYLSYKSAKSEVGTTGLIDDYA